MKYVIQWINKEDHDIDSAVRAQKTFEQWQPQRGVKILEHIGRIDGKGGFVIVETDDPGLVARDMHVFNLHFNCEAIAVIDVDQFARITGDALQAEQSIHGK